MFLRQHTRSKDGKDHTYWSLVETVRTPEGPRQRTVCYLGELNHSAPQRLLAQLGMALPAHFNLNLECSADSAIA